VGCDGGDVKVAVTYRASIGINDKPVGIRQRIGAVLIWLAQKVDSSRLYTVLEMTSSPAVAEPVRVECVTKGLVIAENLFVAEVRQEAGEIAMRAAMPDLFKSEKSRG
jgi:hypothetical protein